MQEVFVLLLIFLVLKISYIGKAFAIEMYASIRYCTMQAL